MNAKELAAALSGNEYPLYVASRIKEVAKQAGLVIVYGASDDLMEFEGAIHDEVGAIEGTTVRIDDEGLVPDFQNIDKDDKDALREYFRREDGGQTITAIWDRDGYSWQYETSIPHETFEIVEDGEAYCRGVVFALADVGAK